MHKYGRDYSAAVMENRDARVTDRARFYPAQRSKSNVYAQVIKKLVVETPSAELVDLYLLEIAKAYKVKWTPPNPVSTEDETGDELKVGTLSPISTPQN
jgi:vacuolar protein sorting-associated protein IST1